MAIRSVSDVIKGTPTLEGGGFLVHRPFPSGTLSDFDPFLLLDEMGPMDVRPGEAKGAPDHPHRGFETLPKADKMIRPHYQEIPAEKIPSARTSDGNVAVRVVAGESLGARAVIETRTPIFYLDFMLKPGGKVVQPVARDFNAFAYVVEGPVLFGSHTAQIQRGNMVPFERDGDEIRIEAPLENQSSSRVLLIGGRPLNEPIARYGPFVMNTPQEIREAFEDYRSGRMGSIDF